MSLKIKNGVAYTPRPLPCDSWCDRDATKHVELSTTGRWPVIASVLLCCDAHVPDKTSPVMAGRTAVITPIEVTLWPPS